MSRGYGLPDWVPPWIMTVEEWSERNSGQHPDRSKLRHLELEGRSGRVVQVIEEQRGAAYQRFKERCAELTKRFAQLLQEKVDATDLLVCSDYKKYAEPPTPRHRGQYVLFRGPRLCSWGNAPLHNRIQGIRRSNIHIIHLKVDAELPENCSAHFGRLVNTSDALRMPWNYRAIGDILIRMGTLENMATQIVAQIRKDIQYQIDILGKRRVDLPLKFS